MVRLGALVLGGAVAVAGAAALVAFVVVPLFVRSTLVEAPPSPPVPAAASPASAVPTATPLSLSGELRRLDPVHYGSGRVTIAESAASRTLRFEGVDIAGAPNMFVYLSDRADGQPGRYVDLGPLKATNGSFNYDVPADVDLAGVRSVVVWCRAFSVTVTYAPLERSSPG